jgi:hypothetical protein
MEENSRRILASFGSRAAGSRAADHQATITRGSSQVALAPVVWALPQTTRDGYTQTMNTTASNQPIAAKPAVAKLPTTTATKLPYGISNFEELITKGYVYIDKTRFIELLENESDPYQLFIRPRKFGKSLFFTMLSCYYDMNYAEKFETLFKGLYIGEHPTPYHNRFAILKFDFSGLNTNSAEEFKRSFYNRIRETLLKFMETYHHLFHNSDKLVEWIARTDESTGAL